MDKKTELQKQIENETGLIIERVTAQEQLNDLLDAGLANLYQEVFGGPPYNEMFSAQEVRDIFQEFLDKKGCIFVALNPQAENRPVAFVVSTPLRAEFELAKLAGTKVEADKTAYFAEDGVAEDYRRNGLSARMKKLLIETNSVSSIGKMFLRTSQQNYKQISAVNKAGGVVISGLFQDVARKRLDGTTTIDENAFYLFDTEEYRQTAANALKLEKVIVSQSTNGDIAQVFDAVPDEQQSPLAARIKEVYPAIKKVLFVNNALQKAPSNDNVLFTGRMYLADNRKPRGPS